MRGENFTHTPTPRPFPIATIFGVWRQVADVINQANFYLNRSKGYAPRGGQNLPYSIDTVILIDFDN